MSIVDKELERLSDRRNQFANAANDFDAIVKLARELEAHCEAMKTALSVHCADHVCIARADYEEFKQERG